MTKSIAHGRETEWSDAVEPNIEAGRNTGWLRSCGWCGSMHPADVANAIRAGAKGEPADRKYGWPHKFYFDGIPNPHAGMTEIRSSCNYEQPGYERIAKPRFDPRTGDRLADEVEWVKKSMAPATTHGKFYTEHLQDASPEDRDKIEQHIGMHFEFKNGGVAWWAYGTPKPEAAA